MAENNTIAALATPVGTSALAIIRISGFNAHQEFCRILVSPETFLGAPERMISLYTVCDSSDPSTVIDEITAIKYSGPRSYTGENMVEVICHGGKIIINRIIEQLVRCGIRYAKPGEFTLRAFYNGKVSLNKAEAIDQMIHSRNQTQQRNALSHYFGRHHEKLIGWVNQIEKLLVETETTIEFEDDQEISRNNSLSCAETTLSLLSQDMIAELQKRELIYRNKGNVKICLIGPQNSGKSSLFNLLLGSNRAIVHEERGTTRDFISEPVSIDDHDIEIFDTAGICSSSSTIENIGIMRSWEIAQSCDLVIWVTSATEPFFDEEMQISTRIQQPVLAMINKTDLAKAHHKGEYMSANSIPHITTSATRPGSELEISGFISTHLRSCHSPAIETSAILTIRQEKIIQEAIALIKETIATCVSQEELLSFQLHRMLDLFNELVGVKPPEEIIHQIFDTFCIGK